MVDGGYVRALLLALGAMTLFAALINTSAWVWGPNLGFLVSTRHAIGRSVAFLIGRVVVLGIGAAAIISTIADPRSGLTADSIAERIEDLAKSQHPTGMLLAGAALVIAGVWVWVRPPKSLRKGELPDPDRADRLGYGPALGMGLATALLSPLSFAWEALGLGMVASVSSDVAVLSFAALLWIVVATWTVWAATLLRLFARDTATETFERLMRKVPAPSPRGVAIPLLGVGALFLAYAGIMLLR